MKKGNVVGFISALLVLLFAFTASSKFFDLAEFKGNMYIQPIPHRMAAFLTWCIPTAEMITVTCLFFQPTKRAGLYAALVLLSIFTIYILAILLNFFRKTPCSCGGVFKQLNWQQHLWFNLVFLALTCTALILDRKKPFHSLINPFL